MLQTLKEAGLVVVDGQTGLRGVISMVDILLRAAHSRFGSPSFPVRWRSRTNAS